MTQKVVILTSGSSWADPGDTNGGLLDKVECFGGGGGGAGANGSNQPGGGGGGAYAAVTSLTVTFPVTVHIGAAGTSGAVGSNGGVGGDTWFNGSTLAGSSVGAKGGGAGTAGGQGAGGSATSSVGTTKFAGGAGGTNANNGSSGTGGGGAAGPSGAGKAGGTSNNGSNGGGTGGGGADNGTVGVANPTTGTGSNGGTGSQATSTGGTGGTSSSVNGTQGTLGAGGGGGYGGSSAAPSVATGGNGGAGSNETIYTITAGGTSGPGGGGGGGGGGSTHDGNGGNGVNGSGGGGAGGRSGATGVGGTGGAGFIIVTYTPTTGPAINNPTPFGYAYGTSQNIGCKTDTTSGTLYVVVDTTANITGVTAAQVKAGENNTGAAAAFSGNSTVSTSSPYVGISGLSSGTTYSYAIVQHDATKGDSTVLIGSFLDGASPALVPVLYNHVGGGGNPYTRGNTGNAFKIPVPWKSGAGNTYLLGITYDGGASVSSVSGAVNGSLGTAAVTALPGSGFLDSRVYVLQNVTAGQETITVTFGANVRVFQYCFTEVFGVATSGGNSGTSSVANSTTIGAGSFTPTNNDSTGGNFIWSYFCKSIQTPTSNTTAITAGTGATLLNADIGWNNANDSIPKAVQGQWQSTSAAVNPAISSASDTADGWNSLAVALPISIGSGTPPPGLLINKIDHFTTEHYGTSGTYTLQCPAIGNLRVIASDDPSLHATTVTDSEGNTWQVAGAAGTGIWYLTGATPNPDLKVYIAGGGGDATLSWRYIDATIPNVAFDTYALSAQTVSSLTSFTASPSPTPLASYGLMLAHIGLGQGPGKAVTAPTGAVWDLCTYTSETDLDLIENADIMAHYIYSASGAQTWTFSITSNASNSTSGGFAAFSATAPASISAATPSGSVTAPTQSIGCTTDTSSGTLYVVVDTIDNILGITAAQVVAGQNKSNATAAFSGNGAVSTTSPSVSISGLSTGTTYGYAEVQVASGVQSGILLGSFTAATTTYTLGGQSATSTEGAPTVSIAYSVSGQAIASTLGAIAPSVSYPVTGESIASAEGAIAASWSGSATLVGQSAVSIEGTPAAVVSYSLSGQAAVFTQGTITAQTSYAVLGESIVSAEGAAAPQLASDLIGQSVGSAEGVSAPGVSAPLSGQSASFSEGVITASTGADVTRTIGGIAIASIEGAPTYGATVPTAGQSAAFTEGAITSSQGADVTRNLAGLTVTSALGTMASTLGLDVIGEASASSLGLIAGIVSPQLVGQSIAFGLGALSKATSVSALLGGQIAGVSFGTITAQVGNDVTRDIAGLAVSSMLGTVTASVRLTPNPCMLVTLPARNFTALLLTRSLTVTYVCCNLGDESMKLQFFSALTPGEENVLTFNFANGLENGATLTGTPTIAISTFSGTDLNPSAIQNGAPQFDPTETMVVVPVSVSLNGVSYLIEVTCGTTNPEVVLGLPAVLPVSAWT